MKGTAAAPAPAPQAAATDYTVQRGDTLFGIARAHGLSVAALTAANPSLASDTLRPGQTLSLPADAARSSGAGSVPAAASPIQPASLVSRAAPSPRQYTVKRGDTLHAIAQRFGLRVPDLKAHNPGLRGSSAIHPGLRLDLPAR